MIIKSENSFGGIARLFLLSWKGREIATVNEQIFDSEKGCGFLVWEEAKRLNEVTDEVLGELICFHHFTTF